VVLAYEESTEPERAVWDAIEAAGLVEFPLGTPASDDPATGGAWAEDRQVPATPGCAQVPFAAGDSVLTNAPSPGNTAV
jgi:hypothetical protein